MNAVNTQPVFRFILLNCWIA